MRIELYRKLKGANPANAIVSGNLAINGVDFLSPDGIDTETLFRIDIEAEEELTQIKRAITDAMVNPNQHSYLLVDGKKQEGDLQRRAYGATVSVETDFDPEALGYLDTLRSRYGLGDIVCGVTRYALWHLTFRDRALTAAERRKYAEQLSTFFANPTFQMTRIVV